MSQRWVAHVDMDAFYAAVEVKHRPELQGRPVVVGGTGGRGVVCSASYEARAWGVHSASPMAQARRLCPQAVVLAPRFDLYQEYSRKLHAVLNGVTPLVEGIALDEAFLDVSGATAMFGPPETIVARLHEGVQSELGLACSVGAGPNKLVAKLASKAAKPKASRQGTIPGPKTVVITEEQVQGFLWPMPVTALWGVGRASSERLLRLGVTTVGSLAALPRQAVVSALGKAAGELAHDLAWGRDGREVVPDRAPKSIGHEETYPVDLFERDELARRLVLMSDSVASRLRQHGYLARTVTLKLRYDDFTTITRSHTFPGPQATGPVLWTAAEALLAAVDLRGGVRLLGVIASGLVAASEAPGQQLQLDLEPSGGSPGPAQAGTGSWAQASQAMDAVRARFGGAAVVPAAALGKMGKSPKERRPGAEAQQQEGRRPVPS